MNQFAYFWFVEFGHYATDFRMNFQDFSMSNDLSYKLITDGRDALFQILRLNVHKIVKGRLGIQHSHLTNTQLGFNLT